MNATPNSMPSQSVASLIASPPEGMQRTAVSVMSLAKLMSGPNDGPYIVHPGRGTIVDVAFTDSSLVLTLRRWQRKNRERTEIQEKVEVRTTDQIVLQRSAVRPTRRSE